MYYYYYYYLKRIKKILGTSFSRVRLPRSVAPHQFCNFILTRVFLVRLCSGENFEMSQEERNGEF